MFVTKKRYMEDIQRCRAANKELAERQSELRDSLQRAEEHIKKLHRENKELESNLLNKESTQTSLTLTFSDDAQSVTPITKVNKDIVRKLVENQYLPSNKTDDQFAIQLAIMVASSDAIEQIISAYEEEFADPDFTDEDD